jgi:hypothetical protein
MVDEINATGIPESTSRTIRKKTDKIKENCKSAMRTASSKIAQIMAPIVDKLETILAP